MPCSPSSPGPRHGPVAQAVPGRNSSCSYKILERAASSYSYFLKIPFKHPVEAHALCRCIRQDLYRQLHPTIRWLRNPTHQIPTAHTCLKCEVCFITASCSAMVVTSFPFKGKIILRLSIKAHRYPVYCGTDKPVS